MTETELEKIFPFKRNWFPLLDMRIHYVDEGHGTPVVMFHACPFWSFSYRYLISEFSRDHRVIAVDLPGFGLSRGSEKFDYTLSGYINVINNFMNFLDLKDITMFIHGWGGTVGMGYAVQHPKRIKSLVIMNSLVFTHYAMPFRMTFCKLPWLAGFSKMQLNILLSGKISFQSKEVRNAYRYPFQTAESMKVLESFIKDIPTVPEAESAQQLMEIEAGLWNFRSIPSVLIWAAWDWLYPVRLLKTWKRYLPGAEIHKIYSAGRYLQEEAPDELIHIIRKFFNKYNL